MIYTDKNADYSLLGKKNPHLDETYWWIELISCMIKMQGTQKQNGRLSNFNTHILMNEYLSFSSF